MQIDKDVLVVVFEKILAASIFFVFMLFEFLGFKFSGMVVFIYPCLQWRQKQSIP